VDPGSALDHNHRLVNPILVHDNANGGDDESLTYGKNGLGPKHTFPDQRSNSHNAPNKPGAQTVAGITTTNSVETGASVPDDVFYYPDPSAAGKRINTRKVTGRNTPSAVNAVFNFRNFWDGRAQNVCNGNNPFGARDKSTHLLVADVAGEKLGPAHVGMINSALCSQSLGPILSSVEM